ncbi:MAG TPA: CvpA family protein [Atribacteraceae bacterium]|nr:CvpA family protein [Atribacteraceae bacterium]
MITEWYSIVCFVLLFLNALRSAWRGFSKEFLVLIGMLIGILVGIRYYFGLALILENIAGWSTPWLYPVGFLVIFIPIVLVFSWIGVFFRRVFEGLDIVWFDAILGFLVGILKGMLWIIVLTLFVLNVTLFQFMIDGIRYSAFYERFTQPAIQFLAGWIEAFPETAFLRGIFEKGMDPPQESDPAGGMEKEFLDGNSQDIETGEI